MRGRKLTWLESGLYFLVDAAVVYSALRWLFGVDGDTAAWVAWLTASLGTQLYRIEVGLGTKE